MKKFHLGLLPRVLIAIVLGVLLGLIVPDWFTRIFLTFNGVFSQLLGFMIPLIIVGLVTAAIGDLGHGAGKMLLVTVLIAYLDTVIVALGGFGVGNAFFPGIVSKVGSAADLAEAASLSPYFSISIPAMFFLRRVQDFRSPGNRETDNPSSSYIYIRHFPRYDRHRQGIQCAQGVRTDNRGHIRPSHSGVDI